MWRMKAMVFLGVVTALVFAGCAARPLDVPTGSLPLKCGVFTRAGAIFFNLTCASKDTKDGQHPAQ
jgi:hypothetical protein